MVEEGGRVTRDSRRRRRATASTCGGARVSNDDDDDDDDSRERESIAERARRRGVDSLNPKPSNRRFWAVRRRVLWLRT